MMLDLIHGNCLEVMKEIPDNSVDAVVTDPPYGLEFMGKNWDKGVPGVEFWVEMIRVLKPGGYLLAFSGTRTYHRMATAIEDGGFEVRDMIEWIYGSGFPKSLNIGKAMDKLQGNEREIIGDNPNHRKLQETITMVGEPHSGDGVITKGTSEWEGWGTALKPAHEPICMARKPKDDKFILDACCGGKMFWFDKNHPNTLYVDKRAREAGHCKHRKNHSILPDKIVDFTEMPFGDNSFKMVVFDPPHIFGKETGNMTKQYGWLKKETWREQIKKGFDECWRVLDDYGTLIFKWNENAVSKKEILDLVGKTPLFGHQVGGKMQTHWMCFMKISEEQQQNTTPAHEPICMARKPLSEKTVAENCLKHGTGGINVDGSRVEIDLENEDRARSKNTIQKTSGISFKGNKTDTQNTPLYNLELGRFPANLIHDNSEEVRECFPDVHGAGKARPDKKMYVHGNKIYNDGIGALGGSSPRIGDSGNASRFFKSIIYQAKSSKSERNKGCEDIGGNKHCTVKPIALMEYLIKMVSRDESVILDPFMGSGTTGVACVKTNRNFIGIELDKGYFEIASKRIREIEPLLNNTWWQ